MNKDKIVTIRLNKKYLDLIEEIKKSAYEVTPPEEVSVSDIIRFCIAYTSKTLE